MVRILLGGAAKRPWDAGEERGGVANEYSATWFDTFLAAIAGEATDLEVRGLARWLPLPAYRAVLDVCCGPGRHAARLAALGYTVTGVDRDAAALAAAADRVPDARFVRLDQREIGRVGGVYDAAAILWQSFGYFDSAGNDDVLSQLAGLLRPGGRLALDVYHREYFARRQGRRAGPRPGVAAIANTLSGNRLRAEIAYADGTGEAMDFELFTPDELADRAARYGFAAVGACCWWDAARPPDPDVAQFQLICERGAAVPA